MTLEQYRELPFEGFRSPEIFELVLNTAFQANKDKWLTVRICQYGGPGQFLEIVKSYGKEAVKSFINERFNEIGNLQEINLVDQLEVKELNNCLKILETLAV